MTHWLRPFTSASAILVALAVGPLVASAQQAKPGDASTPRRPPPVTLVAPLGAASPRASAVLNVWPGKAPSESGDFGEETHALGKLGTEPERVENVTEPTLSVYRPAADNNRGAAMIIAPGGGYRMLAWNKEGVEIAQWATTLGMTGVVLKYRVPRRPDQPAAGAPLQPLQDAQRALSMVRNRASEWGIDPQKIGMMGFSAGGSLAANLSTNYERRAYEPIDTIDQTSCRPDFAVLIYGGGFVDKETGKLSSQFKVTKQTPPMFFAVAGDDLSSADNSIQLYGAARAAGLPAELHVYSRGGHGFGMRAPAETGAATWPRSCEQWLRDIAILPTAASVSNP